MHSCLIAKRLCVMHLIMRASAYGSRVLTMCVICTEVSNRDFVV